MIITNNFNRYPEGSEKVMELLDCLGALKKEQIVLYFMETDETYNRKRINKLLHSLLQLGLIKERDGIIEYADEQNNQFEKDETIIDAFWVVLYYAKDGLVFCAARYPASIVFMHDGTLCEVVVCTNDDIKKKMGFVREEKNPKIECKYYFLLLDDTINELDDSLYPECAFSIITVSGYSKAGVPRLIFHDVLTEKTDDIVIDISGNDEEEEKE